MVPATNAFLATKCPNERLTANTKCQSCT